MAAALVVTLALCIAAHAQTPQSGPAQSPATNPVDADFAKQQQQRQLVQPLNNQPVWSEVRSGAPQYTSIPGRETNVLIQSQGQTWRALRTPIMGLGALAISLAIVGLAVFTTQPWLPTRSSSPCSTCCAGRWTTSEDRGIA